MIKKNLYQDNKFIHHCSSGLTLFTLCAASTPALAQEIPRGALLCKTSGVQKVPLKDPYSAKITVDPKRNFKVIDYAGHPTVVRGYVVWINAKNSYGAYTGPKRYMCYVNESETRVLRISEER